MARTNLRAGIIGLGYGRAHIPGCQAAGVEVTAVCQRQLEQGTAVAQRYGVPKVFADWKELVQLPELDIVVVATPPHLHRAIACRALQLGKHVLCEKPLALDLDEAKAMVDAAKASGRVGMTAFNWRFPIAMQKLRELVGVGALGRLFHTYALWFGSRYADPDAPASWRLDRSLAGTGTLGDMGVHLIDLHRWLFGEFRRAGAQTGIAYPDRRTPDGGKPADAEDFCTVLAELESGAQVTIQLSRVARGHNLHALTAFGSQGAVSYRLLRDGGGPRWYRGELSFAQGKSGLQPMKLSGGLPRGIRPGEAIDTTGYATITPLMREMVQAIKTGRPASPSFEDGMKAQAVVQAIQDAAATHMWVDMKE